MAWGVVYYKTKDGTVPAEDFLDACPAKVEATILAVLEAVRAAPPPAFSGGGNWEALGDLAIRESVSRQAATRSSAAVSASRRAWRRAVDGRR